MCEGTDLGPLVRQAVMGQRKHTTKPLGVTYCVTHLEEEEDGEEEEEEEEEEGAENRKGEGE